MMEGRVLEHFNSRKGNIETWLLRFDARIAKLQIGHAEFDDATKRSLLIDALGEEAVQKMREHCFPTPVTAKTYAQLVEILNTLYRPQFIAREERRKFSARARHSGESFADYAKALRALAVTCGFGQEYEERLTDQFIHGLRAE